MSKKKFDLIKKRKKEIYIGILVVFILGGIVFGLSYYNYGSSNTNDFMNNDKKDVASNKNNKEDSNLEETKSETIENKDIEKITSEEKKEDNSSNSGSSNSGSTGTSKPSKPSTGGSSSGSGSSNTTPPVAEKPVTPPVVEKPSEPEKPVTPPVQPPVEPVKPVEPEKPSFTFPMSANEILNYAVGLGNSTYAPSKGLVRDTSMNTGNSGWDMPIQMIKTDSAWSKNRILSDIQSYWNSSMSMCYNQGDSWNIQVVDTGTMIEVYFLY